MLLRNGPLVLVALMEIHPSEQTTLSIVLSPERMLLLRES